MKKTSLVLAALIALGVSAPAFAAVDAYTKIESPKGAHGPVGMPAVRHARHGGHGGGKGGGHSGHHPKSSHQLVGRRIHKT
ncbi:MAG: hypothetical protein ACHP7N_09250 [Caulobacterales bacterium]